MDIARDDGARDRTAAPGFPSWPFAYIAYAEHISRDYRRHLADLGRTATGLERVQNEGAYDAHLMGDLTRAFCSLALAPYSALWSAMAAGSAGPFVVFQDLSAGAEANDAPQGRPAID
jgi:hypothetical protein